MKEKNNTFKFARTISIQIANINRQDIWSDFAKCRYLGKSQKYQKCSFKLIIGILVPFLTVALDEPSEILHFTLELQVTFKNLFDIPFNLSIII